MPLFRTFTTGNAGYSNATLGIAGVAVAFPVEAAGAVLQVSAPCWVGVRGNATLITFNDANFGSVQSGAPIPIARLRDGTMTHIHIAPLTGTAIVTIAFT
jgi:hypothetical protein